MVSFQKLSVERNHLECNLQQRNCWDRSSRRYYIHKGYRHSRSQKSNWMDFSVIIFETTQSERNKSQFCRSVYHRWNAVFCLRRRIIQDSQIHRNRSSQHSLLHNPKHSFPSKQLKNGRHIKHPFPFKPMQHRINQQSHKAILLHNIIQQLHHNHRPHFNLWFQHSSW